MASGPPDKPTLEGLEARWGERWEADGTYRFDRAAGRTEVYAIDTPPPTVSGSLHLGHVLSYTHTDTVARYRRMRGQEVFYPMGWDDNGLPTERRVQNYFGVRCDPDLPYDPHLVPPSPPPAAPLAVSRPNFVELCTRLTAEDERAFEQLWRRLGLSVDWSMTYTTIGERARRVSQRSFLRLLARNQAYQAEAPTLWDVDFQTAVAQAELEDREVTGAWHLLRFRGPGGRAVEIDTTRPELLAACVALVAHPDDDRYKSLFGSEALTPLFDVPVPVLAHPLAEPDKGTGIAMVCTFGDLTDVVWWRELGLPLRTVVRRDGRLSEEPPAPVDRARWKDLGGLPVKAARARTAELLRARGELVGEPRPVRHAVKFFEKGDRPLEILTSRQWFIRTLEHVPALLRRGRELRWHPGYMQARYQSWVEGLNGDWLISRQRFFGVPFPLWYPVGDDGVVDYERPIVPSEEALPVDPSSDAPEGYAEELRDRPGGFTAEPDVMDTWATSSLTPQIAGGWEDDPDLFARVFPMDLRPQGHDIIRTWLFSTVVRSELEHRSLPWTDAAISGFVLDPDRKKMAKSKGNVVTPMGLLEEHGSDALRYWASRARPGVDTAVDYAQMRVGRRLSIKLLNASKFVLSFWSSTGRAAEGGGDDPLAELAKVASPLDRSMLAGLAGLVDEVTNAFEAYDYARALERTEAFFWSFCDDYLELVKGRAYGAQGEEEAASAHRSLAAALATLQLLFAPFLPFVTEEVWSWWQPGSVHRAVWPDVERLRAADGDPLVLAVAAAALGEVRKAKTAARASMRAEVARVELTDTAPRLAALVAAEPDLKEAGRIADLRTRTADAFSVEVELADPA